MGNRLWAALALAAAIGLASPAHANSIEGKVKSLVVRASDSLHYVVIEGVAAGRAPCAVNTSSFLRAFAL